MPRNFDQVQRDLEQLMSRLRNAPEEQKVRRELLKKMRLLLEEADLITASEHGS